MTSRLSLRRAPIRALTIAPAVLLLVSVVVVWSRQLQTGFGQEPSFQGRTLSVWLEELTPAQSSETKARARAAVASIGTNAIPPLIRALSQRDGNLGWSLRVKWNRWVKKLDTREPIYGRIYAVLGFEALGTAGRPAVRALERLMADNDLAYDSARSLGAMKIPEALPILTKLLRDTNAKKRAAAVAGLGEMGDMASASFPDIRRRIESDPSPQVRASAAEAVSKTGQPGLAIPVLVATLANDPDENVRCCAAAALGSFPERANELEPLLQAAATNASVKVRAGAVLALRRLRESRE